MNLLEQFPGAGVEDLNLYFKQTSLKLRDLRDPNSKFRWHFVEHFEPTTEGTVVCVKHFPRNGSRSTTAYIPIIHVELDRLRASNGFYNWRATAVLLFWKTQRQSSKGVSAHNVDIQNPFWNIFYLEEFLQPGRSPQHLATASKFMSDLESSQSIGQLLARSQLYSLEKAFDAILTRKILARAISRRFCLTQGLWHPTTPSLWFYSHHVGEVTDPTHISVVNPTFKQEVVDFFQGVHVNEF